MPPPSERTLLDGLSIGLPGDMATAASRSYLADGRCVGWTPSRCRLRAPVVIDAELADRVPPAALAVRLGADAFWERWTRAECAAKLADVPMAIWLRAYGIGSDTVGPVRTIRATIGGDAVVMSAAYRDGGRLDVRASGPEGSAGSVGEPA